MLKRYCTYIRNKYVDVKLHIKQKFTITFALMNRNFRNIKLINLVKSCQLGLGGKYIYVCVFTKIYMLVKLKKNLCKYWYVENSVVDYEIKNMH